MSKTRFESTAPHHFMLFYLYRFPGNILKNLFNAIIQMLLYVRFPKPQDNPAGFGQGIIDSFIPFYIIFSFFCQYD